MKKGKKNGIFIPGIILFSLIVFEPQTFASIFKVGETYQINRAKYPEKIVICTTEDAMVSYMEAIWAEDTAKAKQLLLEKNKINNVEAFRDSGKCTLISSFSQAKIIKKGVEAYQAEFLAFPLFPVWGYWDYCGAPVP